MLLAKIPFTWSATPFETKGQSGSGRSIVVPTCPEKFLYLNRHGVYVVEHRAPFHEPKKVRMRRMADKVKMQAVAGGGRICFRGDSRDPSEMFQRGFFSREKKSKWKFWQNRDIRYRSGEKGPMYIRAEHADFYTQAGAEVVQGKTLKSSLRT